MMAIPDSQRYPEKLCLIKHELDIDVYGFWAMIANTCNFSKTLTCAFMLPEKTFKPKNKDIKED